MMDLSADMGTFFNPAEFGDTATAALDGGGIDVAGIASKYAQIAKPGDNSGSGYGQFLAGRAEVVVQSVQFLTPWRAEYDGVTDRALAIHTGLYAGDWRIRYIERDGDIARMILNKQ